MMIMMIDLPSWQQFTGAKVPKPTHIYTRTIMGSLVTFSSAGLYPVSATNTQAFI